MSFYNKGYLDLKKKEIINQENKCSYKPCFENNCNDTNCEEHSCFGTASYSTPYGNYCHHHNNLIKTYYKAEVIKKL